MFVLADGLALGVVLAMADGLLFVPSPESLA